MKRRFLFPVDISLCPLL